jgi:mannose-6-phosphate isomerase-like protein (cupin superfamily)
MRNFEDYIKSGMLEAYVLGLTDPHENLEVEQMAAANEEVRKEINHISEDFERHLKANAVAPPSTVKPFLMATIDYTERLDKGEQASFPPVLYEGSNISDYAEWLHRDDMVLRATFVDMHAKIIEYTPEVITAIVWLKDVFVQEIHHNQIEKFLIVEGTCDITVEEETHQLVPGDYFSIPLYKNHTVKVSTDVVCKIILQRVAA